MTPLFRYGFLLLLFIFVLTTMQLSAVAQEVEPPPRQSERNAPVRTPVVLEASTSPDAVQTILEIPVQADAYIASARPNENFGNAALYVGYHNIGEDRFGAERSLIRFELSSIPNEANITEANLRLYMSFATPSDSATMRIIVRQLNSPWDEQVVTWNNEPAWGPVRADLFVGPEEGWYVWDITDLVIEWQNGQTLNRGIELIGDERVQLRERAFNSRETASNLYPRLIVRYNEQVDDQPPDVTVDPLDEYSARSFTVSWGGSDEGGAGIDYYDVQFQIDGGAWDDWQIDTTERSAEFTGGETGRLYAFRARGVDNEGNVEPYGDAEASTIVDAQPPRTFVEPLPAYIQTNSVNLTLGGGDLGSGVESYDVRYRFNGGEWILWQQQTTTTNLVFDSIEDGLYEFEARAEDEAGLVEPFHEEVEAEILIDANPPFIERCCLLPWIARNATFTGEGR